MSRHAARRRIGAGLAGAIVMIATVLSVGTAGAAGGGGSVGAQGHWGAVPIQGAPGMWPGAGGSYAAWQAWAAQQTAAVESTTWSGELAAQGVTVTSVTFVPVGQIPGLPIPAGITTTAVVISFEHASATAGTAGTSAEVGDSADLGDSADASPGVSPAYSSENCAAITDGLACVEASSASGGLDIEASYTYGTAGSVVGHVELSDGGCPGGAVVNGGNRTFTYDEGQAVAYGPIFFTDEWASSFWRDNGNTNYSYFGSACDYF